MLSERSFSAERGQLFVWRGCEGVQQYEVILRVCL